METPLVFWIGFHVVVFAVLAFDLLVLRRSDRPTGMREALTWSAVWLTLSLLFCAWIWHWKGAAKGQEFLAGYLVEYSLSVDNLFVFLCIFSRLKVGGASQHRVLFWGILGALVMRGIMIAVGVQLVQRFHWILLIFGLLLIYTAIKMAGGHGADIDPEKHPLFRWANRRLPVTEAYRGSRFLVHEGGKWLFTPLAVVLLLVETTDLVFALDSIPAIFGITEDPFIIYTSNACAILGLRALFFVVSGVVDKFVYLKYGLAAVLAFIGVKMLIQHYFHIPVTISLGVVATLLGVSVLASFLFPPKEHGQQGLR